ncbi:MAG: hypothetical protein ACM3X0_11360 [Bacteroidota bacterium]
MREYIMGVDPGRKGAFAIVETNEGSFVGMDDAFSDDPTMPKNLLTLMSEVSIVVVERPLAFPGTPGQSLITLAESYGAAVALARCAGVRTLLLPTAAQWKRTLGVTGEKRSSVEAAMRLYELTGRPPRHDLCEAALLAYYGYLHLRDGLPSS